jgi:Ca-activated chloride channel family protein
MIRDRRLAQAPGSQGPSTSHRPNSKAHRLAFGLGPSALGVLLLAFGCSRHAAKEAPHEIAMPGEQVTERGEPAKDLTGGTGTRAKGEEGSLGTPSADTKNLPAEAEVIGQAEDETAPPPSAPKLKAAASAAPKTDSRKEAQSFTITEQSGGGGLGLSGIGEGGGGIRKNYRAAPSPTVRGAMAQAFGSGHGRLSGAHMALRTAPTATAMPLAPEFNTEAYKKITDNPFRLATEAPLSTFSVDVDTASYSNMRRFVVGGHKPPADAIRVEEWINYFGYDDAPPAPGEPVAVASEVTECPWNSGHELLRVALTTQPIAQDAVPPRNLVFLVDVSGSMEPANKLPLLKRGLGLLARQLRPVDTLSIVVYAGASGVALPPTSGADQAKILGTLQDLQASGSTNGAEGIQLAYQLAEKQFKKGGINRVVLATDGDFNVGVTSEGDLERLIEEKRKSGVFLTVLGFGEGNTKDSTMETLADKGNGNYAYVDTLAEARKVLVHEAGATLVTVAQDVKLQLEFNPTRVKSYRLVGYENRVLADQDFNDDTKDAGEMGAGHHVTAFYEIVPTTEKGAGARAVPSPTPAVPPLDPLKYQTERAPSAASASADLVTVKIRYKAPGGQKSLLFSRTVADRVMPLSSTSDSLRFGAAVAEYALSMRGAPGFGADKLTSAHSLAASAIGADPRGERREFLGLMDRAARLPN